MKQKIVMLKTTLGCDDGVVLPETYFEGKEYTVGEDLLKGFIEQGVVELVHAGNPAESRDTKVTGPEETKPATYSGKKKR